VCCLLCIASGVNAFNRHDDLTSLKPSASTRGTRASVIDRVQFGLMTRIDLEDILLM
jgi:hypothetical protein